MTYYSQWWPISLSNNKWLWRGILEEYYEKSPTKSWNLIFSQMPWLLRCLAPLVFSCNEGPSIPSKLKLNRPQKSIREKILTTYTRERRKWVTCHHSTPPQAPRVCHLSANHSRRIQSIFIFRIERLIPPQDDTSARPCPAGESNAPMFKSNLYLTWIGWMFFCRGADW